MVKVMSEYEREFGVKITFSIEEEPLGTGGPLALAADILRQGNAPFFVLNSDVICDFPFKDLLESHLKNENALGTLLVTRVSEPSKYGVIVHRSETENQIDRFVEKPAQFVSNRINAGIYVLSQQVLDMIKLQPTSIEKEIFPLIAKQNKLFFHDLDGFWMDVGQPVDYLTGSGLYLQFLSDKNSTQLSKGNSIVKNVLVHPTATIGKDCKIGPDVVIGPGVVVEDGVRLAGVAVMEKSVIKSHAVVLNSIVGWNCVVGSWSRVEGGSVLAEDVKINSEVYVNGAKVLPHKSISENIPHPTVVM